MSATVSPSGPRTIAWVGDLPGYIRLIDQTLLPTQLEYRDCRTPEEIWEAIRALRVRGAPAIGVAAAMGVVVGADRIAANGDTANKVGTYGVALLAQAHGIRFYVAAPSSTFDLSLPTGDAIPIEQRDPREVTHGFGRQTAPAGVKVYNPAFDVTPARLIAGIITEKGLITPVTAETIRSTLGPQERAHFPSERRRSR